MTDSEVIRMQREAIAKYCKDDRALALKIIDELGLEMRERPRPFPTLRVIQGF